MTHALMRLAAVLACAVALAGCDPLSVQSSPVQAWSAPALADLREVAASTPGEGLPAETAALAELESFAARAATDPAAAAQLDIAADALYASLANAFSRGAADPAVADPDWRIPLNAAPDIANLNAQRAAGALPSTVLGALLPQSHDYQVLRMALAAVTAEAPGAVDAQGLTSELRLMRIRANLERWRWLPREIAERRLEVRVPQMQVALYQSETAPRVHAVIVGSRATPSPTFAAELRSVTLNPTWTPPSSILTNELLPRFRLDPSLADREGYDVIGADGALVAPNAVDWSARPFRYQLRQRAGATNALGRLRFDLPNPFAVYLHDTPNRALFARTDRALSHGCIRVEDPVGLAEAVIDAPEWKSDAIEAAIETGATTTIPLADPVSIYVLYLTAASDGDDIAYFDDLYRRDERLIRALDAPDAALVAGLEQTATTCPL
jgi:murein L,D-transpeptidase YcbB/YkuD